MCFHFFEVFIICEVMAYLAMKLLFGFAVVNYVRLRRLLHYFDCFSDGLILKNFLIMVIKTEIHIRYTALANFLIGRVKTSM